MKYMPNMPNKIVAVFVGIMLLMPNILAHQNIIRRNSIGVEFESMQAGLHRSPALKIVTGKVVAIEKYFPAPANYSWIRLKLKTNTKILTVNLGPSWFIESQDVQIQLKDIIRVKGVHAMLKGKSVIIAHEITKGEDVLKLVNKNGTRLWLIDIITKNITDFRPMT
jgi:hypothetical protein